METTKTQPKKSGKSGWIIIAVFVVIFLIFGGESSRLTCRHSRQPQTALCTKQSRLLWVFPLSTKTVENVSGAQLGVTSGEESGTVYRVELVTSQGIVPLTSMYTSGSSTKQDVVDQINTYLQSTRNDPLVTTEPGMLSLENLICSAIWLPVAWAFSKLGTEIKGVFGRGKNH